MDEVFKGWSLIAQVLFGATIAFLALLGMLAMIRALRTRFAAWQVAPPLDTAHPSQPASTQTVLPLFFYEFETPQTSPAGDVATPVRSTMLAAQPAPIEEVRSRFIAHNHAPLSPSHTVAGTNGVINGPEPSVAPPASQGPRPSRPQPKVRTELNETILSPETLLARAQTQLANGANDEAAAQLRLCVRLAAKLKQPAVEATARLELGDLARASGDLTTACEHWQMARTLFTTLKRETDRLAAEQRMERARCPSDWVLNAF
jgi:hypothetical protein